MKPSVTLRGTSRLDERALYFVSYDGLVNNNSFQKHGLLTYRGHQYAAWYTADRSAVVGRRALGADTWETVPVGHRLRYDDSHNVISMGVCAVDGRLHIVLDAHSDAFFCVRSAAGLLDEPAATAWTPAALGPVRTTLDGLALTPRFTYPQFLTTPEGLLQLSYRDGVSGDGRNALAEYDGTRWRALGEWSASTGRYGTSRARNMYLHGLDYDRHGRLHAFFTWREQDPGVLAAPGGLTNHDTGYVYSDDRGRTWRNDAGTPLGTVGVTSPGVTVDPLGPDHCLMNQESQAVDSAGRPHALISHVPVRLGPRTGDYVTERVRHARVHHLRKDACGRWRKTEIPVPLGSSQRTRLVLDAYDNAYAVLPYGRIAAASRDSGHTDWTLLFDGDGLNAFGEVVVDETRIAADAVLSFLYQERSTGTTPSPLHVVDFALPRRPGPHGAGRR
ncbi:BNR repeat-containing protein [Streptomyces sp. enrichment culture]|uniref:BNR repeat-containing protein n=1 Tax=Streptomyces sp. enrichment culture TaxID=1795815 RepID=UPI003F55C635